MKLKPIFLYTCLGMIIFVGSANVIMAQQKLQGFVKDESGKPEAGWTRKAMPEELNPEPIFKANKDTPKSKLVDIASKVLKSKDKLDKKNAKIEKLEVITFGEYSAMVGEDLGGDLQISPERLIWVVQIYYPQGYEHDRAGLIKNARAIGIYDAETGEYFGQSITTVE